MPLDPIVDSVDALPEPLRAEYEKGDDGKYHLQIKHDNKVTTFAAQLRSVRDILGEKKATAAQLRELSESLGGLTTEQIKALRERPDAGDFDKRLAKALDEVRKNEVTPLKERYEKTSKRLETIERDNVVRDALTAAGVKKGREKAAMALALPSVKLREDGKLVVLDGDGDERVTTLSKWIAEEFASEHDYLFEGTKAGGSGAVETSAATTPAGPAGATKTIARNDPAALLANLDDVVAGKVKFT